MRWARFEVSLTPSILASISQNHGPPAFVAPYYRCFAVRLSGRNEPDWPLRPSPLAATLLVFGPNHRILNIHTCPLSLGYRLAGLHRPEGIRSSGEVTSRTTKERRLIIVRSLYRNLKVRF